MPRNSPIRVNRILPSSAASGLPQINQKSRGCQWQWPEKISICTHGKSRTSSVFDRIHKTCQISHLFQNSKIELYFQNLFSARQVQILLEKFHIEKSWCRKFWGVFLEFEFSFFEFSFIEIFITTKWLRVFKSIMLWFQEGVGPIAWSYLAWLPWTENLE